MALSNAGKNILITGAGGFIGSGLTRALATSNAHQLILLDNSEHNLYQLETDLAAIPQSAANVPILGDICDPLLLSTVFETYRPEIVYHSAALKHVPLMEKNPLAAVRTNALGTELLAQNAIQYGAASFIMISTDKAVNPHSIMGASKRVAELALQRSGTTTTQMKSLRLINVWGSTGSVVPLLLQQIARGGPVTVTHPDASRYFISLENTIDLVLQLAAIDSESGIFVPELAAPIRITDVARQLIQSSAPGSTNKIAIEFIGLRPGDKLVEELLFANEIAETTANRTLSKVVTKEALPPTFDLHLRQLEDAVMRHDLPSVLDALCQIVPEYRPGQYLKSNLRNSAAVPGT